MYIPKERRAKIDESGAAIGNLEELTYAVSTFMLKMWNSKPDEDTIQVLTKELVVDPKNSTFVRNLRSGFASDLTVAEVHTACRLAYDEFYQRVIRLHRALQCRENSDLEGYEAAITPLLAEMSKEIKKESTSGLIIPGGTK